MTRQNRRGNRFRGHNYDSNYSNFGSSHNNDGFVENAEPDYASTSVSTNTGGNPGGGQNSRNNGGRNSRNSGNQSGNNRSFVGQNHQNQRKWELNDDIRLVKYVCENFDSFRQDRRSFWQHLSNLSEKVFTIRRKPDTLKSRLQNLLVQYNQKIHLFDLIETFLDLNTSDNRFIESNDANTLEQTSTCEVDTDQRKLVEIPNQPLVSPSDVKTFDAIKDSGKSMKEEISSSAAIREPCVKDVEIEATTSSSPNLDPATRHITDFNKSAAQEFNATVNELFIPTTRNGLSQSESVNILFAPSEFSTNDPSKLAGENCLFPSASDSTMFTSDQDSNESGKFRVLLSPTSDLLTRKLAESGIAKVILPPIQESMNHMPDDFSSEMTVTDALSHNIDTDLRVHTSTDSRQSPSAQETKVPFHTSNEKRSLSAPPSISNQSSPELKESSLSPLRHDVSTRKELSLEPSEHLVSGPITSTYFQDQRSGSVVKSSASLTVYNANSSLTPNSGLENFNQIVENIRQQIIVAQSLFNREKARTEIHAKNLDSVIQLFAQLEDQLQKV